MDENYEWDSEFPGDMELLETLHVGLAGPRSRLEAEPELGVRAFQKGRHPWPHRPTPPPLGLSLFPARPAPLTPLPWQALESFVVLVNPKSSPRGP